MPVSIPVSKGSELCATVAGNDKQPLIVSCLKTPMGLLYVSGDWTALYFVHHFATALLRRERQGEPSMLPSVL